MMAAAAIGVVLGAGSMLWNSYTGTGHQDGWTPYAYELEALTTQKAAFDNPATSQQAGHARSELLGAYGIGAVATIVCGVGRMLFSAWPLHPLAWCVAFTYPANCSWFSFFLAWGCKGLVMRYGGVGLYKRLKPVAIGLIAGEALAMSLFMVVKIIASLTGHTLQPYNALPG
jgi:hypothetical protein